MNTLDLVDTSSRELAASFPLFDPERDSVDRLRRDVLAGCASVPIRGEEHTVPGPDGIPDVRISLDGLDRPAVAVPAILYLHGGSFNAGAPDMADAERLRLAQDTGAVVVAVNDRLATETPFPGPIEDCDAALTWLFGEAGSLGIDPTRIATLAHSAGGGLAAALALLARDRNELRLQSQFLIYRMFDPRTRTPDAPVDNPATGEFMWTRSANRFGWDAMLGQQSLPTDHRLGHFAPALASDVVGSSPTFTAVGSR
jgi:acetyl esterase/lipase